MADEPLKCRICGAPWLTCDCTDADEPLRCDACGVAWIRHAGMIAVCRERGELREIVERQEQEIRRLQRQMAELRRHETQMGGRDVV